MNEQGRDRQPCPWTYTYEGVQLLCDLSADHDAEHLFHLGPATGTDEVLVVAHSTDAAAAGDGERSV